MGAMDMIYLGRGLFLGGLLATAVCAAPALLLSLLPPAFSASGFIPTFAALLVIGAVPIALMITAFGLVALLIGWLQRKLRR